MKEQEFAAKEKLEIVNVLGFAFQFARPPNPSHAPRGEDRIPFELFLEYTAFAAPKFCFAERRRDSLSFGSASAWLRRRLRQGERDEVR
ncbi:hypothetical protein HY932_01495 [Candidatus Falkowbacteria bacterium]|nr:hypothetical protein [Candidatus Falkowbacteria bacterium]